MADISLNKRNNQSSPLSQTQVDENWTILETAVNSKGEGSGTLTGVIITDNSNIINATVSNGASSSTITISDTGSLTANRVLASPNGSTGSPSYRALVNADLPTVSVEKGGTNSTTSLGNNKVMVSSGGAIVESSTIDTTELSYLNGINGLTNGILRKGTGVLSTGSIDLTADVTGILPAANGGTGLNLTGSFANGKLLISTATGFALGTLTAGSNIVITNASGAITIALDSTGVVLTTRTVNGKALSSDVTLLTTDIAEGTNLYFTNARVNTQIDAYVTAAAPLVKTGGALTIVAANTSTNGYLTSADWNTFNGKGNGTVTSVSGTANRITSTGGVTPIIDLASGIATAGTSGSSTLIPVVTIDTYGRVTSITTASNPQGTVTSVTATSPVTSSGGATPVIAIPAATTSANGYLTSTDWNTFNGKGNGTVTSITGAGSVNGITLSGTVTSSGNLTIGGALSGIGNSQLTNSAITINGTSTSLGGSINVGTVTSVTGTAPIVSSGGATPAISMAVANTSTNGYLSSTDWNTFSNKIGGNFTYLASGSITFDYDIWYCGGNVSLPNIGTNIGKILFVKNTNTGATITVTPTSATIDGVSAIILSTGAPRQGGIMIQATSATTWYILSHTGTLG